MKKINEKEAINMLINLNQRLMLDNKEHIKKYYRIRDLHSQILDSMNNYIDSGKLKVEEYFAIAFKEIKEELNKGFSLDNTKYPDKIIFDELFMYKNHNEIPSLTEIFIEKKKIKEINKLKLLNAMNESIVGLFKIIDCDSINGYVTLKEVFTNKEYKIIDISLSSTYVINKNEERYMYNRIITYDGISFGTGLPIVFSSNYKRLKEFIKKYKDKKINDFTKCILLYEISKDKDNKVMSNIKTNYN